MIVSLHIICILGADGRTHHQECGLGFTEMLPEHEYTTLQMCSRDRTTKVCQYNSGFCLCFSGSPHTCPLTCEYVCFFLSIQDFRNDDVLLYKVINKNDRGCGCLVVLLSFFVDK